MGNRAQDSRLGMKPPQRFQTPYQKVWVANAGSGPWPCDHCEKVIDPEREYIVHHRDHDHANNAFENLGPMHRACHASHHLIGNQRTKGKKLGPRPPEVRAKIAAGLRGIKRSAETRAKLSEANRRRQWNKP